MVNAMPQTRPAAVIISPKSGSGNYETMIYLLDGNHLTTMASRQSGGVEMLAAHDTGKVFDLLRQAKVDAG